MLKNLHPREDLLGLARQHAKRTVSKKITANEVDEYLSAGWELKGYSKNKKKAFLFREKAKPYLLESKVWTLLFKMGFPVLSGQDGAKLVIDPDASKSPETQIDCVAIDEEVGLAIECKTFAEPKKDPNFNAKIAELSAIRKGFSDSIKKQYPLEKENPKRHIGTILFTWDFLLTESDIKRAGVHKVTVLDEAALDYYLKLVDHLGPAARYQFLSEVFPDMEIAGLEIKNIPCLQTRAGKTVCYTFSLRPENLLKIAYVAHRVKGRESEEGAYQRMCTKSRLKKIAKYITNGGNFPTNIVINIERPKHVRFSAGEQKGGPEGAKIGTITLSPTYGSVWVIDGQHRLFAYSGHKRAASSYLNVLAFEGLTKEQQAKLFVDINHEQKSVKSNLLDELWADLHWDSKNDETRTRAIIARAVRELNKDNESPFFERIQLADDSMTDQRCISLTSVTSALDKANLYLVKSKRDAVEHKALWSNSNESMLKRTKTVLNGWFKAIADQSNGWWDAGRGPGGGLGMNNGVTACINVLKDVIVHLETSLKLFDLRDHELVEVLVPYADALGKAVGGWSADKRVEFRGWVGGVGQDKGTMAFNEEIHKKIPEFSPSGLKDFIEAREAGTRTQAFEQISQIEKLLKDSIFSILKKNFPEEGRRATWWWKGVPQGTRDKVDKKMNASNGEEGEREDNFDFIDYRDVILHNWPLFSKIMGQGGDNVSPKNRTTWLAEINNIRKFTDHDKGRYPTLDEVKKLQNHNTWLQLQIAGAKAAAPATIPVVPSSAAASV